MGANDETPQANPGSEPDADTEPPGHGSDASNEPPAGALTFGNRADGGPAGAAAFGGGEPDAPLRGAVTFGNNAAGAATGARAFGTPDAAYPLRGALAVGNAAEARPTGAMAFGDGEAGFPLTGALAFGAPQGVPERLGKDSITYDFVGKLLRADDASLAGIRRDARDRTRERVLRVLQLRLGMEGSKLRSGLRPEAIPWGKLRRAPERWDRELAGQLRQWASRAPGGVLGVGHVQQLLEGTERLHTFALHCDWDVRPLKLDILRGETLVGVAESAIHKEQSFFAFKDANGVAVAYVDALVPNQGEQRARVRTAEGELVGSLQLERPAPGQGTEAAENRRFTAALRDSREAVLVRIHEQRATQRYFRAGLHAPVGPQSEMAEVGLIEDKLVRGKIKTRIELDVRVPRMVAWAMAVVMADLARLRRSGWPGAPVAADVAEPQQESVESVEAALGPRRRPRRPRG